MRSRTIAPTIIPAVIQQPNGRADAPATEPSAKHLRKLFEQSLDMLCVTDMDGHFLVVNPAWRRTLGYSAEEMLGRTFFEFLHPDDMATSTAANSKHATGAPVEHFTNRYRARDGGYRDLEWSSLPSTADHLVYSVARDVTASTKVRTELRETREYLDNILESSTTFSIIGIDLDGRILSWNEGARRHYGYTAKEVVGRDPSMLYTPEDVASGAARSLLDESYRNGVAKGDFDRIRKDGSWFVAGVVITRRDDAGGHPIGYLLMSDDITEKKRAQDELARLSGRLEERVRDRTAELETTNAELESFAYTVSHDLRAPLRAIDGFVGIMLEDHASELGAEARDLMNDVVSNARRMGALIDDLLSFSRLGRQPVQRRAVAMEPIVRTAWENIGAAVDGREIEFSVGTLPRCSADPTLMVQVFVNLLDNAVKFTRTRAQASISVAGHVGEDGLPVYSVSDNGVGFDMAYVDKLFGVFQRLHRADEYEGTGAGLAIVQRIVRRHGGRVWATAVPGKGAAFYFTLGDAE